MKLLPISIVAKRLGVSTESVYRLGKIKKLKIVTTGPKKGFRVREEDLLKFISYLISEEKD